MLNKIITSFKNINHKLFISLSVMGLVPTIYTNIMNSEEKRQMLKLLIKRIVPTVINPDDNYFTLDRIEFNFPIFKDINIVNQIKVNQDAKFDYSSLPNELVLSKCNKTIEYGDEENKISIEPEEYDRYENKINFIIQSHQNRNDAINIALMITMKNIKLLR